MTSSCRGAKIKNDGKIFIDSAGTGKFKKIKVKSKPSSAKFEVNYPDNSTLRLTMALWEETPNFKLFGTRFNNSKSHTFTRLAARNTTGLAGKIRGNDVTFIDNNANGVYHDEGIDAIMVGKGKNARIDPFGRYVMLKETNGYYPYELKLNKKDASLVRTRPYKGQLAPLRVDLKTASGARPSFLIVKGNGEDASAYYDVAKAIDEPIWLPVGGYQVRQGYFTIGKGKKQSHIFIGPGRSGVFKVEAGKVNTWEMGGSGEQGFWLLGKLSRGSDPTEVIAENKELRVFGNFGESYFGFTAEDHRPASDDRTPQGRRERQEGRQCRDPQRGRQRHPVHRSVVPGRCDDRQLPPRQARRPVHPGAPGPGDGEVGLAEHRLSSTAFGSRSPPALLLGGLFSTVPRSPEQSEPVRVASRRRRISQCPALDVWARS